jgi:predicted enzyme related to lactoylglutathione lyase
VHTGAGERPGVQGLLHKRQEPRAAGGPNCFECTIAVDDLDAVTEAIERHGGAILMRKAPIPTVGVLTKFTDPEGNVVGAMAYEHPPHT